MPGMESLRIAFMHAAEGRLRLDHAGLSYQGKSQVLSVTGWHVDGMPFAMVTAPFSGNPQVRARQAARDIVAAHAGPAALVPAATEPEPIVQIRREVRMSQKGSGLARLMGGLKSLDANADALADRLDKALSSLTTEMATTTAIVGNVEQSAADLQAVNRLYSNGGPALPTSDGSSPPSPPPAAG